MKKHGEFSTGDGFNSLQQLEKDDKLPIPQREHNPYVEAFWKWWPELYKSMDTFRITGGEPLLSKDTFKVLDKIIETKTPNKNLKLSINSNLCVEDKLVDKFIEKAKIIIDEERVKEFILYTSVDTFGKQAEYIRFGLEFDKLFSNIDRILTELPKVTIVVMSTFNIFSPFNYEKLVRKIYDYKVNQNDKVSGDRLIAIMILAVFCTIFWACFEQAGSSITVWVDKCVNLVGMTASQTNAINPFYIVLLAIPFSWLWTKLGAMNKNPNTPMKFALGIFQLGLGFLIFASTAHFIGDNGKIPFLFVFLGYFLITTGELFLSPIGLSKVTELSPKKMVAFMMGVWFLSSTFAHYISGVIAKLTTSGSEAKSNWLSELSYWFMGNPDSSNEAIATLLQYNSIYAQIGFVTIFISLFVVIISPFIKKLMHGIH